MSFCCSILSPGDCTKHTLLKTWKEREGWARESKISEKSCSKIAQQSQAKKISMPFPILSKKKMVLCVQDLRKLAWQFSEATMLISYPDLYDPNMRCNSTCLK